MNDTRTAQVGSDQPTRQGERTAHIGRTETGTVPRLTPNERKVLGWLARRHSEDFGYYSFAPIMKGTKLPRAAVRLACRSLKRKGLAEFLSGLWSEYEDRPAGSGYAATRAGAAAARSPAPPFAMKAE